MALKTWDEIGNLGLTTGQKNVAAAFEAIGNALRVEFGTVDTSGVTAAQAKALRNFVRDLSRIQMALHGAEYVLRRYEADAGKTAIDAVPDGNL